MNRIAAHIESMRSRVASLDPKKAADLDAALAIDFEEHFAYQETQARAHAMGKITSDEAMVIYVALGESRSSSNGGWAKSADLATKISVTKIIQELLTRS